MPASDPPILLDPSLAPDTSLLITEDGKPVGSIFIEKQRRLLSEPLWTSWKHPAGKPFRVLANVGLFYQIKSPAIVPDVMLALDVETPRSIREKNHCSYFMWIVGKPPDVAIQIVSDKYSGEDTEKLRTYQHINVPYYVIFDPDNLLDGGVLRGFVLHGGTYRPVDPSNMDEIGLGLTLWRGRYENFEDTWLRWIELDGERVPTGKKFADAAKKSADESSICTTLTDETQRATESTKRAETAEERIRYLEKKMLDSGLSTNGAP